MITLNNLDLNKKIKYGRYKGKDLIWRIVDKYNTDYSSEAITLMLDEIPFTKAFDGKETSNNDSNRQEYGNNRYKHSNIRQWLNKQGLNWYKAQHSYDAPPNNNNVSSNPYDAEPGFLTEFTDEEINSLIDTQIKVVMPGVDGEGIEILTDKIFLPSSTEMGLADEISGKPEGTKFPVFSDDNDRIAQYNGSSKYYWLRSPNSSISCYVRYVSSDGSLHINYACSGGGGVRPLCNLKSDILVSSITDSDGCYTTIFTTPHKITLDKPLSISKGESLEKLKFAPKINGTEMQLENVDKEKLTYVLENLKTDTVDLEVEGKDGKIDNIAYAID